MAVKGLEQTTTLLDQAKRLGGLLLIAVIAAAFVVGTLVLTGLFGFVPAPQVTVLGFVLPPSWTAFVGAFTLALTMVLGYVYFAALVRSSVQKALEFWRGLPAFVQALALALGAGILAGLSLYLTDRFLYTLGEAVVVAGAAGVVFVVLLLTLRLRDRGWTLREWARTLYTSALIGGVVAALTAFAFAGRAPGYTPAAVFLSGWGICLYLLFRRRHRIEDSVVTRLLTSTGYAQMRQIDTVPVSIGTGLVLAVVVAVLVGVFGTTPESAVRRAGFSVLLVWPVVTFATSLGWPSRERTTLVLEDINVRNSTELREVTIRNLGDWPVDLRGAKITDANDTLYQININVSLGAGEAAKFEMPEIFELAAHDRYEVIALPFDLVLTREATEPTVVTRDGREFKLLWIDQVPDADGGTG